MSKLATLIDSCLNSDPAARITAAQVKVIMSKVVNANRSIVEEMLRQLERHADSLEDTVAERTHELVTEMHKVDDLLREMLPA